MRWLRFATSNCPFWDHFSCRFRRRFSDRVSIAFSADRVMENDPVLEKCWSVFRVPTSLPGLWHPKKSEPEVRTALSPHFVGTWASPCHPFRALRCPGASQKRPQSARGTPRLYFYGIFDRLCIDVAARRGPSTQSFSIQLISRMHSTPGFSISVITDRWPSVEVLLRRALAPTFGTVHYDHPRPN